LKQFLWLLQWTLKAAIFLILFAFALNNQEDVQVHFFWGLQWRSPLVLVLLGFFAAGVAVGVLGMVPRWWRQRRLAQKALKTSPATPAKASVATGQATDTPYGP
jgi:lipopolysaccharide assembly protein A